MTDKELFGNTEQLDCSDCVNHGGDWDCDHVQCRKGTDTISRQQAVHGYWKAVTDDGIDYKRICSCCGEEAPFDESEDVYLLYPHCPWCGAPLDIKGGNGNE